MLWTATVIPEEWAEDPDSAADKKLYDRNSIEVPVFYWAIVS